MNVLVTGAASGIGRATCLRLARDGRARGQAAKIAAVDLGPSPGLDDLIEELRALGAEAVALPGDMGTADAEGRCGGVDGPVGTAGINRPGPPDARVAHETVQAAEAAHGLADDAYR